MTSIAAATAVLLALLSVQAQTYTNPVLDADAADPAVLRDGNTYHVYVTGYWHYSSTDLVNWSGGGRFYNSADWAPDMYKHTDGNFYLYYTHAYGGGIGIAKSTSPDGGFSSVRSDLGGIDAHYFHDDDGQGYLYRGGVMAMRMSDPETPNGSWQGLTTCSQEWEWDGPDYCCNEGPWMVKHNGTYYLMYSGSGWAGPTYAVGYATSNNPMGPFQKFEHNPIIARSDYEGVYGPGHHSMTMDDNGVHWVVYHQRSNGLYGGGEATRFTCIDPLWFDASGVMHCRVTRGTPRPAPNTTVWPNRNAYEHIEFESHDGAHNKLMFRKIGTTTMGGNTQDGTYITYRNVDFGQTPATEVEFHTSSTAAAPGVVTGTIEVRLGGLYERSVATCQIVAGNWQTQSFALTEPLTGVHDIVLTFAPVPPAPSVANVDWLQFNATTGARAHSAVRAALAARAKSCTFDVAGRALTHHRQAPGVQVVRTGRGECLRFLLR